MKIEMIDKLPVWTEERWARYYSRINKDGPVCSTPDAEGRCWLWTGMTSGGYGVSGTHFGKEQYTHRIALIKKLGRWIEKGKFALHICHAAKSCCNPDHLYEGTRSENMRDAARAGKKKHRKAVRVPVTDEERERVRELEERQAAGEELISTPKDMARAEATLEHWGGPSLIQFPHAEGPCREWTGRGNCEEVNDLRGVMSWRGKPRYAHQAAYELAAGEPVPKGMIVMHACDNHLCTNPSHLSVGTRAENNADRGRKWRVWGWRYDRATASKIKVRLRAEKEDWRRGKKMEVCRRIAEAVGGGATYEIVYTIAVGYNWGRGD